MGKLVLPSLCCCLLCFCVVGYANFMFHFTRSASIGKSMCMVTHKMTLIYAERLDLATNHETGISKNIVY